MKFAIQVEDLSKLYHIRDAQEPVAYRTLRDDLMRWMAIPFRGLDQTRSHEFWALRSLSFQVETGEVLGVIGSNGAGKSTLLKIISRITRPTAGRVRLRGRVASLLEVGTGFHPELTGRENIYLSGAILGMSRREIDSKFDEIVEFSGVTGFLDTPVKRYSSGMNLRLGFAVAAHVDPDILIVDEVLAVGDANFQRKCLAKMEEKAARDNRTILFVSHNLAAIRQLCHRVIWLERGTLRQCGPAASVIDAYMEHENQRAAA